MLMLDTPAASCYIATGQLTGPLIHYAHPEAPLYLTFYAHASFRLEADGLAVITDPYTPGPDGSGFDPINEPADLVIMSSTTDRFHSDPTHITGDPTIIDALALSLTGEEVKGVPIRPFPAMENLNHDFGRDPDANAMYLFTIGGLRFLHMGDIGNPIEPDQLDALRGQVDILLALAGGRATIALDALDDAIAAIGPRVIIPMHYYSSRGVLNILPVDDFLGRHPAAMITRVGTPHLELIPATLPATTQIYLLEQSR
jgi:L-ascorbate metabolism protein UlaG (beta-lactamase superfamily)